ncbi:MAG: peptidylprolyl isomerase [Gammaproteobacteria bacterium]|nr:peptidylprolyl isomerase [Gammaproteobacteria bacterium]
MRRCARTLAVLCALLPLVTVAAESSVFAVVDGVTITRTEFEAAVHGASRQKFFHGGAEQNKLEQLRREVAQQLIDRQLLLAETRRRGIVVAEAALQDEMRRGAAQLRLERLNKAQRVQVEAQLRQQSEEQLRLAALERQMRQVTPDSKAAQAYYAAHKDLFTTPERLHLAVILLKVAPSAPVTAWRAAEEEAKRLQQRLQRGENFADLARMHSGDASAEQGGDLGFVHKGMLSAEAQLAVDKLTPGKISEPVPLLQGIALFRLLERQSPQLNAFEQVAARAQALWQRDQGGRQWEALLQRLRAAARIDVVDTTITINE